VEAKQDNLDQIYERIVAGKGTTEDWRGMYNSPPLPRMLKEPDCFVHNQSLGKGQVQRSISGTFK
jgi:hypothetical protein